MSVNVNSAIERRISEFRDVVENGSEFDSAVASVIVLVLKDLQMEIQSVN